MSAHGHYAAPHPRYSPHTGPPPNHTQGHYNSLYGQQQYGAPFDDITRRVKVDAPDFSGQIEPKVFIDWLNSMDRYFNWYDMNDKRRVRFDQLKLTGPAQMYWISVERGLERLGRPPITTWGEMKEKLREQYLPTTYKDQLLDELNTLHQGTLSVADYKAKLHELLTRCDIVEAPSVV